MSSLPELPERSRWRRLAAAFVAPLAFAWSLVATAAPPRDTLTMLVPDNAVATSWQVKVWTDSAAEEGIRLETLTDSQFLALGATAASKIAGLIVPDSAHINASDAVVAAIKQYAYTGGKLMLVYDAGALTDAGFYPLVGNSRFAGMVGVDYVLYEALRDQVVGFGPVVGTKARLDSLSLPPGKYMPYVAPATLTSVAPTTAFVPTSRLDPGGTQWMSAKLQELAAKGIEDGSLTVRQKRLLALRKLLGLDTPQTATLPLRFGLRVGQASRARDRHAGDVVAVADDAVDAVVGAAGDAVERLLSSTAATAAASTLQAISAYAYGPVGYFHYVTVGDFPGTVYLSSPEHGLVAGTRNYGSGSVLFVNLPLGYFKAIGTDSAPLHGFLNLFARDQVKLSTMSVQPRGVGGMVYNWHIDDGDDLTVDTKLLLNLTTVLRRGPFSIHLTAGPDVIRFGDGDGMNLPGNPVAQDLVRRLANVGKYAGVLPVQHEIGSHGGWIHDYWGANANEANVPDLTSLLVQNFAAIENVTGRRITEYSSPVGNTPLWAVRWLEARGVKAAYTVGDGGAATVRSWRAGARIADRLWSVPVTPQGKYATFEEFDDFGITDALSAQWLLDVQSFVVNHQTNRMVYNHPPGARGHLAAIVPMLLRGDRLDTRFRWYTMTRLAEFSQRRVETTWDSTSIYGYGVFTATHPTSLADMTWLLPRSRYRAPVIFQGSGQVDRDGTNWLVTANGGTVLRFVADEI